jgi:hypothetical protein
MLAPPLLPIPEVVPVFPVGPFPFLPTVPAPFLPGVVVALLFVVPGLPVVVPGLAPVLGE